MSKPKEVIETFGSHSNSVTYRNGKEIQVEEAIYPAYSSVEDLIKNLQGIQSRMREGMIDFYEQYGDTCHRVVGWRDMTEVELERYKQIKATRVSKEQEDKIKREESERQQYEKLKAKFEPFGMK